MTTTTSTATTTTINTALENCLKTDYHLRHVINGDKLVYSTANPHKYMGPFLKSWRIVRCWKFSCHQDVHLLVSRRITNKNQTPEDLASSGWILNLESTCLTLLWNVVDDICNYIQRVRDQDCESSCYLGAACLAMAICRSIIYLKHFGMNLGYGTASRMEFHRKVKSVYMRRHVVLYDLSPAMKEYMAAMSTTGKEVMIFYNPIPNYSFRTLDGKNNIIMTPKAEEDANPHVIETQDDEMPDDGSYTNVSLDMRLTKRKYDRHGILVSEEVDYYEAAERVTGAKKYKVTQNDNVILIEDDDEEERPKEKEKCPVCYSEEVPLYPLVPCRHGFCEECIMRVHGIEDRCPLCRQTFTGYGDVMFD